MKEYIERRTAINEILTLRDCCVNDVEKHAFSLAYRKLRDAHTADVVEVVRCKNCAHKVDYCGRIMCDKNARRINDGIVGLRATKPESFCSDGVKRAE